MTHNVERMGESIFGFTDVRKMRNSDEVFEVLQIGRTVIELLQTVGGREIIKGRWPFPNRRGLTFCTVYRSALDDLKAYRLEDLKRRTRVTTAFIFLG